MLYGRFAPPQGHAKLIGDQLDIELAWFQRAEAKVAVRIGDDALASAHLNFQPGEPFVARILLTVTIQVHKDATLDVTATYPQQLGKLKTAAASGSEAMGVTNRYPRTAVLAVKAKFTRRADLNAIGRIQFLKFALNAVSNPPRWRAINAAAQCPITFQSKVAMRISLFVNDSKMLA